MLQLDNTKQKIKVVALAKTGCEKLWVYKRTTGVAEILLTDPNSRIEKQKRYANPKQIGSTPGIPRSLILN